MSDDALLSIRRVSERVSLSASRIYQLLRAGQFPRPVKVGALNLWSAHEVGQWVNDRLNERRTA